MLLTSEEKRICQKYSKRDADGKVHCFECPLTIGKNEYDYLCKANSVYNQITNEWELDIYQYDEDEEEQA